MSRYIHDKVNHELIPISGYGSRLATSVNDKTLTVHGSFVNIDNYNYGKADITDAVELIAPIESTLVASRVYAIGDQFVYNGFLYEVTTAIALDEPIVIGTNCQVAQNVSEQIGDITNQITNNLLSNIEVYQTTAYSGSISNNGTIASITLPKGKYIVIPCGYCNLYGGYIAEISQWVNSLSILTLSSQQTLNIQPGTSAAVTFTNYQVKFIKIG